ncbi:MAG: chromate transporter [bacterium]|nr:chromate transporter [bacterium]
MKDYLELFWAFARIGGLTFGGGLTMLPMLTYELVDKKRWISEEELMDCYAIGQCTPGIIAVNTATYIGYQKKGVMGGIVATLGMITPSLVIISIIAMFLSKYMDHPVIMYALNGIRGAVCALMLNTVVQLARKSLVDWKCVVISIVVFLLALLTEVPTIVLVIAAGVAGVLIWKLEGRRS